MDIFNFHMMKLFSMGHFNKMKFFTLTMLGLILLMGCGRKKKQSLPNIVMIISDDQGWRDYGFMGHDEIKTPNLDKLATQSLLFTRGYVTAPLCNPSLASIITGLHPHQHKISSNDPAFLGKGHRWSVIQWSEERKQQKKQMIAHIDKVPTIPKMLKKLGYVSFQTGKWWLGNYSRGGFSHGMTHGDLGQGAREGDNGLTIGRKDLQPIYNFIENTGEAPFFLWYAPLLPHTPHNAPERLVKKYLTKTNSIHLARYWANCEWFDETCGELLKYLDDQDLSENTIVIFISDNGWIQNPNGKNFLPRSKRSPFEGGVRTPVMIKWPNRIAPRIDDLNPVSSIDLATTILNICGLNQSKEMQGINLLDTAAVNNREAIFGAAYSHDAVDIDDPTSNLQFIWTIQGRWKLIQQPDGKKPKLFNIYKNPQETNNYAQSRPKKLRQMKKLFANWWNQENVSG